MAEHDQIPKRAHGTKTAALSEKARDKRSTKGIENRGVHGARTCQGIEQNAAFRLAFPLREEDKQKQSAQHERGHDESRACALRRIPPKGVSPAEKNRAYAHADDEAGKARQGVQIPSGKAEQGSPGAAEKNQSTQHPYRAEDEARQSAGASSRLEFPKE